MASLVPGDQTIFGNLTVAGNVTSLASKVPTDPFGDLRVVQRTSLIDLKSTFGVSDLRDIPATAGTGAVTATVGLPEYTLAVTAANDSARLASAERGRYVSGYGAEVGIAVRLAQPASAYAGGQRARWGYYDGTDGFFFQVSAAGVAVGVARSGAETIVPQAEWNVDRLDGTGPSGQTLDVTKGNICQVVFSWYGYGGVAWRVALTDPATGAQMVQVLHRWAPAGQTSTLTPNLPLYVALENRGTAGARAVYVAGRQFSVIGHVPHPVKRITSAYRVTLTVNKASGFVPVLSLRRKAGFLGNPVRVSSVDMVTSNDCMYQVRVGGALTGAAWGAVSDTAPAETALEMDASATAAAGGVVLYCGLAPTGSRTLTRSDEIMYSLEETSILSLVMSSYSANSAVVSVVLRMSEEW